MVAAAICQTTVKTQLFSLSFMFSHVHRDLPHSSEAHQKAVTDAVKMTITFEVLSENT